MNDLLLLLGIESWKPVLTAFLLPPVPMLVLLLVGVRLVLPRRGWGWTLVIVSVVALWLGMCNGTARLLEPMLLKEPPPLSAQHIAALKASNKTPASTAIVVLGGGMEPLAPEYGMSSLGPYSLERLHYALWLARQTGLPVAFSGGAGWSQREGTAEAEAAARIAADDFKLPLRWTETRSRDTRENAQYTLPLLQRAGITHIVLVTHGWHMPRALRHFQAIGKERGISVEAAPMGLARHTDRPPLDWMPSSEGYALVRNVVREGLGRLFGA